MEVSKLVLTLENSLALLRNSQPSQWSHKPVAEIIADLEIQAARARSARPMDLQYLRLLFAPIGAIQEISMYNGSGDEYLKLSEIIDQFTDS